uniref:Uncharacterized protein n=1 Tax=Timema monikensis TaxID=170555 RepID=A0A7R9HQD7_9NEOP|nr:unnamed protein product [Timema monikensis]
MASLVLTDSSRLTSDSQHLVLGVTPLTLNLFLDKECSSSHSHRALPSHLPSKDRDSLQVFWTVDFFEREWMDWEKNHQVERPPLPLPCSIRPTSKKRNDEKKMVTARLCQNNIECSSAGALPSPVPILFDECAQYKRPSVEEDVTLGLGWDHESLMMSLVAYDSSDESDDKDEEASNESATNSSVLSDFQQTSNDQGSVNRNDVDELLLLKLPTTLHSVTEKPIIDFDIKGKKGLFSTLPPPKMKDIDQFNAVIEEETPPMLNKHQINKKETVKITLPALSQKSSGLFALLPPPKHMTVKEAKRNLVPNAVSKKPTNTSNSTTSTHKPKTTTALINYVDSGDDSDENNDGNFFSLNDDSATKTAHLLLNATSCSNETLIHSGTDTLLSTGVEDSTNDVAIDQPLTFCSELHPNTLSNSNEEWQQQSLSSEMKNDILLDEEAVSIGNQTYTCTNPSSGTYVAQQSA